MINKNKIIIFPILAVSAIFMLSTLSGRNSDLSPVQVLKEETYTAKNVKTRTKRFKKIRRPLLKNKKRFVKSLQKNNLSLKIAAETKKSKKLNNEPLSKKETVKDKKVAANKTKKKDENGEVKKDEKNSEEGEGNTENTDNIAKNNNTSSSTLSSHAPSTSDLKINTDNSSTLSSTSVHNIQTTQVSALEEAESDETDANSIDDESITILDTTPSNTSLSAFSNEYFQSLLKEDKLSNFRQALALELTQEQMNAAYSEALSFLFEKSDEDFILFDSFVKSSFSDQKFTLSIANTFKESNISSLKIDYSADLLNQILITWDFEEQDSSEFDAIFQATVDQIPENLLTAESISILKDNIASASQEFSNSSLEVSSI